MIAVVPAKVNLGLEVVGRRQDGYHELVTLFQAVSVYDRFVWTETGTAFEYVGPPGVSQDADLVWQVLTSAPDIDRWTGRLRVVKRIPMAAGLGGGSANAGLALRLAFPNADGAELAVRGATIGADVPFFIRGGTALATGTGTELVHLRTPRFWLVLVTPTVDIPQKTRALYSGLEPGDFSDGTNVRDITMSLANGLSLSEQLPNAFLRQLLRYHAIRYAYNRLSCAGALLISVSGAGPTLYALTTGYEQAARIAARLDELDPRAGVVNVVRTVAARETYPAIDAIAAAVRGRQG